MHAASPRSLPVPARSRSTWILGILLVATTLLAPLFHCDLLVPGAHASPLPVPALSDAPEVEHGHSAGPSDMHCGEHRVQCVPQVALPARVSDQLSVTWLAALAVVAAGLAGTAAGAVGTRGPPDCRTAVAGRAILTRFCISRR